MNEEAWIEYKSGVKVTISDARKLEKDKFLYGNCFCSRITGDHYERLDPRGIVVGTHNAPGAYGVRPVYPV